MTSPKITIAPYSDRAIVLRSVPEDFFKNYSEYFVEIYGKWQPNLENPTRTGKLPGWIFSKKREPEVRQIVNNILNGTLQPIPSVKSKQYQCIKYAIAPSVGETLYLNVNGSKYPFQVTSVKKEGNIITSAVIRMGNQQSEIKLDNDWYVPGYNQPHTITR